MSSGFVVYKLRVVGEYHLRFGGKNLLFTGEGLR